MPQQPFYDVRTYDPYEAYDPEERDADRSNEGCNKHTKGAEEIDIHTHAVSSGISRKEGVQFP